MDKDKLTENTETMESIEEHYAKLYSDLPEEVVKMLISTHPLYGKDKELAKDKDLSTDKLIQASLKQEHNQSEATLEEDEEIDEEDIEDDEYEEDDDEDEEEDDDDEKEFLSSLFSKHDKSYDKASLKKYLVLGTVLGLMLIFALFVSGKAIKNKEDLSKVQNDKFLLEEKLDALEMEKQQLLEKNSDLTVELENLKQNSEPIPNQASAKNNTATETTIQETAKTANTVPAKKTYTVVAGDSLWKISKKLYGSGNYYLDIMKANNIKKEGDIFEGMTLNLPDIKGGN